MFLIKKIITISNRVLIYTFLNVVISIIRFSNFTRESWTEEKKLLNL